MTGDRLAVVGCGAVTRQCHLPALAIPGPFRLTTLLDSDDEHARAAALIYLGLLADNNLTLPEPRLAHDVREVLDEFDVAIVATPPDSHVDITTTLVESGKHVLVEKPVTCSTAELTRLATAVAGRSAVVVPAHVRRLFPSADWVRRVLAGGRLGTLRRVRWAEGMPFAWPVTSPHTFGPAAAGGGPLHDLGLHVLDLLGHWLGWPAELVSIAHNAMGGTETEVELELTFSGVPVHITLSRLRELANAVVIEGSTATLQVDARREARYVEYDAHGRVVAEGSVSANPSTGHTRAGLFWQQLVEFERATAGAPTRLPRLDDIFPVTRLIERCHRARPTPLARPWTLARTVRPSRSPRVSVTGATGFIGANIVETLLEQRAERVTAIGHRLPKFTRLAHLDRSRLGQEHLDIRDATALKRIFDSSDIVIHTTYGNAGSELQRWSTTVDGTAAVVAAAKAAGVRRLVLLSSMAVYEPASALEEHCRRIPHRPQDRSYAQQKLAAERIVHDAADDLEVTCLQPGVVYGPFGPNWTIAAIESLRADNRGLPSGPGGGICNAVHVLDVAAAAAFLATAGGVDNHCFLLRGPEAVAWGTFYDHYRDMLGLPHHNAADDDGWPERLRSYYADRTTISNERLHAIGFSPEIDLPAGMAHTAAWASWAGLV